MTRRRGAMVSLVSQQGHINLMARVLHREGLLQEFAVPHDASAFRSVSRRVLGPDPHLTWLLGRRSYDPRARSRLLIRSLALAAYLRLPGTLRRRLPPHRRVLDPMFDGVIARHIRRARPAVLITGPTWGVASLSVARSNGIGTALMVPDDVWAALALHERDLPPGSPRLADTRALVAINDRAVSQSDIVFVESRQVADHAVANGGDPARMVVLGQGIDLSALVPAPKPPGARPLRVLSISQVRAQKGVIYTGEATQLAAAAVERFVVVGRTLPDGRGEADRLSRMPNVSLLGEVSPHEVRRHLAEADVLVLATLADSMPRAVMEGLASGLPVIVTPESGYADTVIDGVHGFIVPSRDPAAIAAKLELLSADPALRIRMGLAARTLAEQFSWERVGARFLDEITVRMPALGRGQPSGGVG